MKLYTLGLFTWGLGMLSIFLLEYTSAQFFYFMSLMILASTLFIIKIEGGEK